MRSPCGPAEVPQPRKHSPPESPRLLSPVVPTTPSRSKGRTSAASLSSGRSGKSPAKKGMVNNGVEQKRVSIQVKSATGDTTSIDSAGSDHGVAVETRMSVCLEAADVANESSPSKLPDSQVRFREGIAHPVVRDSVHAVTVHHGISDRKSGFAAGPGAKLAAVARLHRLHLQIPGQSRSETEPSTSPARSPTAAQSKCTNALRHSQSEWWVVQSHPPPKPPEADLDGYVTDDDLPFDGPAETWCGLAWEAPGSRRTQFWARGLFGPLRRKCSGRRNRYDFGGFDLDLTYVTSRVIAMSFPAKGLEAMYRNPYTDVVKFLSMKHGDNYRVYNLCGEKSHSVNGFPPSKTAHYGCADHCPPQLPMLAKFCRDVEDFLRANEENVAVVHCKAGKGRTGTHICALLMFAGAFKSSYEALLWYEVMRGGKRSGVTIPDQIRWVAMLERWLRHKDEGLNSDPMGPPNPHRLRCIRLGPVSLELLRGDSRKEVAKGALRPVSSTDTFVDGVNAAIALSSTVSLAVAVVSRDDMARKRETYRFPTIEAVVDENRIIEVELQDGPVWQENDGMLEVVVSTPIPGKLGRSKTWKKTLHVWWHHSYLRRRDVEGERHLMDVNVPKVWILGLQKDLDSHKKAPSDFTFRASFEDVKPGEATETCRQASCQSKRSAPLCPRIPCAGVPCAASGMLGRE